MLWTVKGYGWYEWFFIMSSSSLDAMNSLNLWITWMIPGCELSLKYYEKLKAMVDINKSKSWAQDYWYYELLRVVDEMGYFWSWA